MIIEGSKIQNWIDDVAKPIGYRRKGKNCWIKFTEECALFLHLQTNSAEHFLNLCVCIRELSPNLTFKTFKVMAHVSSRADKDLGNLLNLGRPMASSSRERKFKHILSAKLIPRLETMGTIEGIKQHDIGDHVEFSVWGFPARRLLGVPLGPRYTYRVSRISEEGKTAQILGYELYERDSDTDRVNWAGSVDTLEEAENWAKKVFTDITRQEAAELLYRFLKGRSEQNEFQQFLNAPLKHDQLIRSASREIIAIPKKFPPKRNSGAFCGDDGLRRIDELSKQLQSKAAKQHLS